MENNSAQVLDKRENFSSKLASFFSTLSSAVGLGNIWKFPVLVGLFGGASFILCYLGFLVLIGIPVMISEFVIGRNTRANAISAFDVLKKPKMKIAGILGVLGCLFLEFYYSSVTGWVYAYIFRSVKGVFNSVGNLSIENANVFVQNEFNGFTSGLWEPFMWQAIAIGVVAFVLILGVKKGIERVTKIFMPILFVLILICAIVGIMQPGSIQGIKFIFMPNFSNFGTGAILFAMGLAFFKLSVGTGGMITYGSYFTKDTNLVTNALKVSVCDVVVSLLAGLAIFPVVFSSGLDPQVGPSLLFNTVPLVFSKVPMGNVLLVLFFLSTAIAATMSMVSLVECIVAFLSSKLNRKLSVLITAAVILIVGFFTVHKGSLLNSVNIFGINKTSFDVFDYVSQNVLLPLAGLLFIITVGWLISKQTFKDEITNCGKVNNKTYAVLKFIICYITPLLILFVLLDNIIWTA